MEKLDCLIEYLLKELGRKYFKYSNIDKKALPEIETNITEFMMEEKKKYVIKKD